MVCMEMSTSYVERVIKYYVAVAYHFIISILLLCFSPQGIGVVAIFLLILAKDVQLPPELRGFIFYAQVREDSIKQLQFVIIKLIVNA